MERLTSESHLSSDRRKPKLWDRIKDRNSSSPSLHKVGIKNWSTRSLPRFGSFGSPSIGTSRGSSSKSTPSSSPIDETFNISEESLQPEQQVIRDYFSLLPSEVKLQILSYLPLKTIARASLVSSKVINSNCRCVNSGKRCVMMVFCSRQSIRAHSTKISLLLFYFQCSFRPVRSYDILICEVAFK
jgi:hypothetical protein